MSESVKVFEPKNVYFIDAYNFIYRAFHGNKMGLMADSETHTNALFTVSRMLLKLKERDMSYASIIFDGGGGNFRHELVEDYKANRKEMPEELKPQIDLIKEACRLLGYGQITPTGIEADDLIGHLALRSAKKGYRVHILSGDKDFRQLVNENIVIEDTQRGVIYDRTTVFEKMGVYPEQVIDYLSLVGDSSDNVKGVDLIGEKKACKLLQDYGNIEGILENKEKLTPKIRENLEKAYKDGTIALNRKLIGLKVDLNYPLTSQEVAVKDIDKQGWNDFCDKYKMYTLKVFVPKSLKM